MLIELTQKCIWDSVNYIPLRIFADGRTSEYYIRCLHGDISTISQLYIMLPNIL